MAKPEPSSMLPSILMLIMGSLVAALSVLDHFTQLLVPFSAAIPLSVKRINFVLAPALAAIALLPSLVPLPYRAYVLIPFCLLSLLVLGPSARQEPFWALAVFVVVFSEIFWLPRIHRRFAADDA